MVMERVNRLQKMEEVQASEAAEILVELSSLMGNVTHAIEERQKSYFLKLRAILEEEGMSVAKAEIIAKTSDEWSALEQARGLEKTIIEVTRSLKKFIQVKKDEEEVSY